MRKMIRQSMAVLLVMALAFGVDIENANCVMAVENDKEYMSAEPKGNLSDKVTGTWSYWDGSKEVVQTNAMLLDKLPTLENKGKYRWTTDDYDAATGAIDVGGFSTSMAWNYSSTGFGNSTYAIPFSYVATANGMYVTKPSTILINDENTSTYQMSQPEDGSLTDFVVGANYSFSSSKIDKVTEWSADVVMENTSDSSQYMKTTMVQGSPFAYFQLKNSNVMTIKRKRNLPSEVISYNGNSIEYSTMIVIRVYDNQDLVSGYSDYDYYAVYLPKDSKVAQADATASYADNHMGDLTVTFGSSSNAYMTIAYLCESTGTNDSYAIDIAKSYEKYAYNFVTDTSTSFVYNRANGTVTTRYEISLDKKSESSSDVTLMGILPHQYKNMTGYTYIENTTRTIRGTMKYMEGTSYQTVLTYSGILPSMPAVDDTDKDKLQEYVDLYMDEYGPTDTDLTKESYDVNTYDTGKKLNRAVQAMEAAEACGDDDNAEKLLSAIEKELADWYTYTGEEDEKYFYYDDGVGSLFGFPQAYYTVDGMTDHHFHYGYFIQASAQVSLRDPAFADDYGNIVDELIGDIATYEKNNPDSRYPFLRYFSTYEGHSWASGHANFADGNNQESSSEALNAWSALILWGAATGDSDLEDLGVYLYQTEISAVNTYWFDVDGDVLDSKFTKTSSIDSTMPEYAYASMVWGGKYTYATWWTAEPLQIQGINILPMTSSSFYYAKDSDFILKNWNSATLKESKYTGDDKSVTRWNELWSAYLALADPELALDVFDDSCEPEAGDSKAHAYHYIMALDNVGTPNLDVSCDMPLATTFTDEDGNMTYVVYNPSDTEQTATFTDGATMQAKAGEMSMMTDAEVTGKSKYTVEHYLQNDDGTYMLFARESKSAKTDSYVTASEKSYEGYALNTEMSKDVMSGVVTSDGGLVLKLYYDISDVVQSGSGVDTSMYTSLGSYNGYSVSYYIMQDDFGIANVQLLDGNQTFYVVYSADYNATNTTGYLNGQSAQGNILQGVYNLNLSTLEPDTYNTIKAVCGDKMIYIIVKYGDPAGAPDTSDFGGETVTQGGDDPVEACALNVGSVEHNTIVLTFRNGEDEKSAEETYNVYVDDVLVLSGVSAGTYTLTNIEAGNHTVKVTAVYHDHESDGITASIKVEDEVDETGDQNESATSDPNVTDETTGETTEESSKADDTTSVDAEDHTGMTADENTGSGDGDIALGATEDKGKNGEEEATDGITVAKADKESVSLNGASQKVAKVVIKEANKKKISAKKIRIKIKKVSGVKGYQVFVYKTRKTAKKVKKPIAKKRCGKNKKKLTVKSRKIKNRKKLYIRVRAYVGDGPKTRIYGKWSKVKKVKIKKK